MEGDVDGSAPQVGGRKDESGRIGTLLLPTVSAVATIMALSLPKAPVFRSDGKQDRQRTSSASLFSAR
jgi:hypothetical protein